MKKISYLLVVTLLLIASCQPKPKTAPVDTTVAKVAVAALMDKYLTAFNAKDVITMTDLLTDGGLYCGTDASELMNKQTISEVWKQAFSDTSMNYNYSVDRREIRINPDGNSAIVLEQFTIAALCPKIPARLVSHVVKSGDTWMFDFLSYSFIPKNEDLGKLNKVLESTFKSL